MAQERTYYLAVDIGASSGRHMLGWMQDGKLYFNLTYAQSGYLSADNIKLSGKFTVCSNAEDGSVGGHIGYMPGSSGNDYQQ
jgi:hypothetical protein